MESSSDIEPIAWRTVLQAHAPAIVLLLLLASTNVAFAMLINGTVHFVWIEDYEHILGGLGTGILAAELALHSIWTVFGRWQIVWRGLASVTVAMLLVMCFFGPLVFGMSDIGREFFWREIVKTILCLPILLLCIQTPMWILHSGWGWQIRHVTSEPTSGESSQLSIGGLLLATAVIAAAIACVRLAAPQSRTIPAALIPLAFAGGCAVVLSLTTVVPALFATLKTRRFGMAMCIQLISSGTVLLILVTTLSLLGQAWPDPEDWCDLVAGFAGNQTTLLAPLLVLRSQGYRLQRFNRVRTPRHSVDSSASRAPCKL